MMAVFFFGIGVSLFLTGFAQLAVADRRRASR